MTTGSVSPPRRLVTRMRDKKVADDQLLAALRANAEEVLADLCPAGAVHRFIAKDEPYDTELWRKATELGWLTVSLPEAYGGLGGGVAELAVLQRAIGERLAPIPFLGTALFGEALTAWPAKKIPAALLPEIAAGALIGAIGPIDDGTPPTLSIAITGHGATLDGTCSGILDSGAADWLVLEVKDPNGDRGLALVPTNVAGVELERLPIADRTRAISRLSCRGVALSSDHVLFGPSAKVLIKRLTDVATLLIASDSMGGAFAIFELTIEWLQTRRQFGKPIGSFQALKHRAAELKVAAEMADILVKEAVSRNSIAEAGAWPALAKFQACEAYQAVASDAVQMHGGIGFTWEAQPHLYLKRASLNRALFGNSAHQLDRAAGLALAEVA